MDECEITIAGASEFLILTPAMITLLVDRTRRSLGRELCIPAEVLFPLGYTDYLVRVFEANADVLLKEHPMMYEDSTGNVLQNAGAAGDRADGSWGRSVSMREVYAVAVRQIGRLSIQRKLCFDVVSLCECQQRIWFRLYAGEGFFMWAKRDGDGITYSAVSLCC